jgi:hypothetical protein
LDNPKVGEYYKVEDAVESIVIKITKILPNKPNWMMKSKYDEKNAQRYYEFNVVQGRFMHWHIYPFSENFLKRQGKILRHYNTPLWKALND